MPRPVTPYVPTRNDEQAIRLAAVTLLGKAGILRDDLPDIMQEMRIALFKKGRGFRKCKKVSFASYRTNILSSCAKDILRERTQPSSRYKYNPAFSLDELLVDDDEETATYGDYLTTEGIIADGTERDESERWALEIDCRDAFNSLSKSDQRLFLNVMHSSTKAAAQKMGIAYTTLISRYNAIILYLKNALS